MENNLKYLKFKDIDINDSFFDSLIADYTSFINWFESKKENFAYVHYSSSNLIDGFLYYKLETEDVNDISPPIKNKKVLKIGTLKIDPHGTKLGERFIKKAFDYAIIKQVNVCYVTLFEKQQILINLLKKYGFEDYGIKITTDGKELVLIKDFSINQHDIFKNYPLFNITFSNKYLISIYPEYHSIMFPDSILNNENYNILNDVSYTNSIHKTYITRMKNIEHLKYGDILVIYRTADKDKSAEYSSVATSICVVEDVKSKYDFNNFEEYYNYANTYSLFNKNELSYWYSQNNCYIIKMIYNLALKKRITRHDLIKNIGLCRSEYCGFMQLKNKEFKQILEVGEVNESIIIN